MRGKIGEIVSIAGGRLMSFCSSRMLSDCEGLRPSTIRPFIEQQSFYNYCIISCLYWWRRRESNSCGLLITRKLLIL
jgi:hypothetical protein